MVGVRGGEGVAIVAYGKIKIPIAEKLWRTLGPLAESRMWKTSCGPKQDQRSLRLWATAGFRQPAGTEFRFWIGSGPICCAVWVLGVFRCHSPWLNDKTINAQYQLVTYRVTTCT